MKLVSIFLKHIFILLSILFYGCNSTIDPLETDTYVVLYQSQNILTHPRFISKNSLIFSESKYGDHGGFTELKKLDIVTREIEIIYSYGDYPGPADMKKDLLLVCPSESMIKIFKNDSLVIELKGQCGTFSPDGKYIVYEKLEAFHTIMIYDVYAGTEYQIYDRGLRPDWDDECIYFQFGGNKYTSFKIGRIHPDGNNFESLTETIHEAWYPKADNGFFTFMRMDSSQVLVYQDTTKILKISNSYYPDILGDYIVYCSNKKLIYRRFK